MNRSCRTDTQHAVLLPIMTWLWSGWRGREGRFCKDILPWTEQHNSASSLCTRALFHNTICWNCFCRRHLRQCNGTGLYEYDSAAGEKLKWSFQGTHWYLRRSTKWNTIRWSATRKNKELGLYVFRAADFYFCTSKTGISVFWLYTPASS